MVRVPDHGGIGVWGNWWWDIMAEAGHFHGNMLRYDVLWEILGLYWKVAQNMLFLASFSSVSQWCPTLCDPMNCSMPGLPVYHQFQFKLTSIESVMPSSHLILFRPLLLLPPIPPSIRVFSNESTLRMRWPKYWSFSFSIIPSKEHPAPISFRMDWLDLLAVQGTVKSLLQHHSSKASILRRSAFFTVQLSHPYMTTGSLHVLNWQECY